MEPPLDKVIVGSENTEEASDRFSDLPKSIIHHIFSYLCTNDIPRVTGVSRKFRDICLSSSDLDVEADFFYCKCDQFCNFVNKYLQYEDDDGYNRDYGVVIERFRLHWFCKGPHYYEGAGPVLDQWIQYVVDRNVQELDIGVHPGDGQLFVIPPSLSSCQSLRELKLNLKRKGALLLQPGSFTSLVALTLSNVFVRASFSGGMPIGEWISTSFKCLKRLCLDNVGGVANLTISSSSLEDITISGFLSPDGLPKPYVAWDGTFAEPHNAWDDVVPKPSDVRICITGPSLQHLTISSCKFFGSFNINVSAERLQTLEMDIRFDDWFPLEASFSIFAPSLLVFLWAGPPFSYSCLEHFLFLRDAIINLRLNDFELKYGSTSAPNFVVELLHSVRYAQLLELNIEVLQYFRQPGNLDNLHHLVVNVQRFEADNDKEIFPFLTGLLNLRTLTIKLDNYKDEVVDTNAIILMCLRAENYATKNEKPQKLKLFFQDREVDMYLAWVENAGMLEYILNCEDALEKVTFLY